MEISFSSNKLAKNLNDVKAMMKNYGDLTKKIQIRLSVLESAQTLDEVPKIKPVRCHQLSGNRKNQFAVDISKNYRLIFEPNHNPFPVDNQNNLDLKSVTKITILDIEDYH